MFCVVCGAKLRENAKFCINCGTRVEYGGEPNVTVEEQEVPVVEPEVTVEEEVAEVAEIPESESEPNDSGKIPYKANIFVRFIMFLLTLCVIAGIAASFYFLGGRELLNELLIYKI